MQTAPLPRVDEHTTVIAASVDEVWPALLETLDRRFSRPVVRAYARIVGCAEATASGPRPLAEGANIPGFRVTVAAPARELVLEGRHRFSSYVLTFRLDQLGSGSSRLRAESRARFPGMAGRVWHLGSKGPRCKRLRTQHSRSSSSGTWRIEVNSWKPMRSASESATCSSSHVYM
jgi:hypothetical protein